MKTISARAINCSTSIVKVVATVFSRLTLNYRYKRMLFCPRQFSQGAAKDSKCSAINRTTMLVAMRVTKKELKMSHKRNSVPIQT